MSENAASIPEKAKFVNYSVNERGNDFCFIFVHAMRSALWSVLIIHHIRFALETALPSLAMTRDG